MSTTENAAKWDVAADDGTEFVVSVNGKTAAERMAAEKLAELGKPAVQFKVTLAQRGDHAPAAEPLADDLLTGIDPAPAEPKPEPSRREATPDPKPAGRKPAKRGAKKAEPTAASTKQQIADAAKEADKAAEKKATPEAAANKARAARDAAKQKRAETPAEKPAAGQPRPGTARAACIAVLTEAGTPLKAKEIAKRVLDSGQVKNLTGKTPEASISALLVVSHQKGGDFIRTAPGTFGLRSRDN